MLSFPFIVYTISYNFPGFFRPKTCILVNTESRISDTINSNWHDSFLVVLSSRATNLLSSGGSMPLQPGRQDVGQLHLLLLLLLLPPHLLDANASLDLVLLSHSLTLQHCLMLVIHPS